MHARLSLLIAITSYAHLNYTRRKNEKLILMQFIIFNSYTLSLRLLVKTLQQSIWPTEIQKARLESAYPAVSLVFFESRTRNFSLENNIHPQTSGIKV